MLLNTGTFCFLILGCETQGLDPDPPIQYGGAGLILTGSGSGYQLRITNFFYTSLSKNAVLKI